MTQIVIEPNPFIVKGKPLDPENTIYAKLGINREQHWKEFGERLAARKHELVSPNPEQTIKKQPHPKKYNWKFNSLGHLVKVEYLAGRKAVEVKQ